MNKTFIIGTDIMYGKGSVVLPWHIVLSGLIKIPLRGEDLPWHVTLPLEIPQERKY